MKRPIWKDVLVHAAAAQTSVVPLTAGQSGFYRMHESRKEQEPHPHAPFLKWLLTYVYEIPKFIKRYQVTVDI